MIIALLAVATGPCWGQESAAAINLPFASTFGIGEYEIEGRSVQVYRIPISVPLKKRADEERWGLKLTLPVSMGFYRVTESEDLDDLVQRFETIAVTPGVELTWMANDALDLRPFFEVGMGTQVKGEASERLYSAGLKSRYQLPTAALHLSFGGGWKYNHTDAHYSFSNAFTTFELGSDLMFRRGLRVAEYSIIPSVYGIRRHFNGLEFDGGEIGVIAIEREWEIGVTVGAEPEITLWGMKLPRLGVAYRWGDGLDGFVLNFGFPL